MVTSYRNPEDFEPETNGKVRTMDTDLERKIHNPLLNTDCYKMGHMEQYIPGIKKVYSYLQARSDKTFDETVFYGLQYLCKEHLTKRITHAHVDKFIETSNNVLGKTSSDVIQKMRALADIGYFPVEIKAVPEGTVMPVKNVLMTIQNTLPDFYWCPGFIETMLLKIWYPITVATTSYQYRKLVNKYFDMTVDPDMHFLKPYMVHDFGARGASSEESLRIDGIAHLLSFRGSDSISAYQSAIDYYNAMPSRHNIMTAFQHLNTVSCLVSVVKMNWMHSNTC